MKRVGFSLVLCRYIDMDVEATIGHFNLIIVDSLVMKKESRIGHLNFIKALIPQHFDLTLFIST